MLKIYMNKNIMIESVKYCKPNGIWEKILKLLVKNKMSFLLIIMTYFKEMHQEINFHIWIEIYYSMIYLLQKLRELWLN